MIQKKLWTELVTSNQLANIIDNDISTVAGQIDTLLHDKFNIVSSLQTFINYVKTAFFTTEGNNQWSGLNIFLSSYSIGDLRFTYLLNDKIKKYLAFYYKFIYDDGLAKKITIDRDYEDHTDSTNNTENTHSELPQIELDNFEQGIKYASTMDKNDNTLDYDNEGEGHETRKEVTWDEAMTNLRTMLFNELVDYIINVPNMIYNHYSLDTMPYVEIIKSTFKYFENLAQVYHL